MGTVEINLPLREVTVRSVICIYGDAASDELSQQVTEAIKKHWNEPVVFVSFDGVPCRVKFDIGGMYDGALPPEKVWYNDDPVMNYFRIEHFAEGNVSFVDGIGCNTGYFKLDNLLQTSTTAAHEYGHTIGLVHPKILDVRGGVAAGIMYPRGTLCDAGWQYDPLAKAGEYGGFLDPKFRRVLKSDVEDLGLNKLFFDERGVAVLGEFSSMFHAKHG